MAGWRDPPPHTAAPPDGGYRGALARHVRHVRPVGDDGVFLLFHDRLGRVISSTSTSSQAKGGTRSTHAHEYERRVAQEKPACKRHPAHSGITSPGALITPETG